MTEHYKEERTAPLEEYLTRPQEAVHHIVAIKMNPEMSDGDLKEIRAQAKKCLTIPGCLSLNIAKQTAMYEGYEDRTGGANFILHSTFQSAKALERYNVH